MIAGTTSLQKNFAIVSVFILFAALICGAAGQLKME
jgi:hypothetical protein